MMKFLPPACGAMFAAFTLIMPAISIVAQADVQPKQSVGVQQKAPAPAASSIPLAAPQTWQPADVNTLLKRLRNDKPDIIGLTPETKRALMQILTARLTVGRMSLENAREGFVVAQKRLEFFQAQAKADPAAPQAQNLAAPQSDVENARAFVLTAQQNVTEVGALIARAQSIPVIASSEPPAVQSAAPLRSRTLQYTPADAAALIKRNPLLTPDDRAKTGVKPLEQGAVP